MDEFTLPLPGLSPVLDKDLIARFDGGTISSDGGLLVLREIERRTGLANRLAACLDDPRDPDRIAGFLHYFTPAGGTAESKRGAIVAPIYSPAARLFFEPRTKINLKGAPVCG